MNKQIKQFGRPGNQQGMATLLMSVILLIIITMVSLYTAKVTIVEQKITANEYRAKQAFEATQAATEYAMAYLNSGGPDQDGDGVVDTFDSTNLPSGGALSNGSAYTVTMTDVTDTARNPSLNAMTRIEITTTGGSDDGSISRTVTQLSSIVPLIKTSPDAGVATPGPIALGANANISNTSGGTAIRSGDIANSDAGNSTNAGWCDDTGACYSQKDIDAGGSPTDLTSAEFGALDLTTATNDEFFEQAFSFDRTDLKSMAYVMGSGPGSETSKSDFGVAVDPNGDGDFSDGQNIVWIDGDLSLAGGATIGSADNPVILYVDGVITMSGNVNFFGMIYTTSNFGTSLNGTIVIEGAVLAEGGVTGNGTPDISFSATSFDKITQTTSERVLVPGSWRDW